eukprot:4069889-Pyramimonas_sp.AAC.1
MSGSRKACVPCLTSRSSLASRGWAWVDATGSEVLTVRPPPILSPPSLGGVAVFSIICDGCITVTESRVPRRGSVLTTDQSDAGSAGIFPRRTNQTQDAR